MVFKEKKRKKKDCFHKRLLRRWEVAWCFLFLEVQFWTNAKFFFLKKIFFSFEIQITRFKSHTLQINHWIAVGTIPTTKLNGMIQYGPSNPYSSFARDHVTAALFTDWGTCPLHTLVPIGFNKISRCASTTETITTKNCINDLSISLKIIYDYEITIVDNGAW